jgi:flagellar hook assembly protein FlgD
MESSNQISWDGKDAFGDRVPAGIYFVRFQSEDSKQIQKVVLLY